MTLICPCDWMMARAMVYGQVVRILRVSVLKADIEKYTPTAANFTVGNVELADASKSSRAVPLTKAVDHWCSNAYGVAVDSAARAVAALAVKECAALEFAMVRTISALCAKSQTRLADLELQ